MIVAELDGTVVVNIIVATLEEAIQAFPKSTWVECPAWIGIGMDINMPEPLPEVIQIEPQPTTSGTQTI